MDANTLMQLAQRQAGNAQQQAVDVSSVMGTMNQILEQARGLVTTNAAGKTPEMVRVEAVAELEAQNRTQAVAGAMGLSPDLQADMQVMLAQDWLQNTLAARQSAQQIAQKESVGFFDNPLGYLVNQFTLQDDYTVYDGQVNAAAQAKQAMADLDSRVAAAKQTAANIATKVTEKTIADQLQAAENEIKLKRMDYDMKMLGNEASRLEKVYALGKDQFQSYYQMYQIANNEEAKAMQREQFARMLEQDNERRALKADKAAEEAEILADIHRGEQYAFGQALTPAQTVKMHFGKQSPLGIQLQQRYAEGQRLRLSMPAIASESITGRTQRFSSEPFAITSPAQRDVIKAQLNAVAAVREADKTAKPEVIEAKAAEIFDKQWAQWNRVIDPKDQTNPLAQLPVAALANVPSLQQTNGWKLFMAAKQDKLDSAFDASELHSFLSSAVASGTVKLEDAVTTLTTAGQAARVINNEANKLQYLTGKQQQGYNARLHLGNPLGVNPNILIGGPLTAVALNLQDKMVADITKPEEARQAIIKALPLSINTAGTRTGTEFYPSLLIRKGATE